MEKRIGLQYIRVVFVILQLFAVHSAVAASEEGAREEIKLPQIKRPTIDRDWYPPAALKRREQALVMIAFKIDESGQIVKPRFAAAPSETEFHKTAIEFLTRVIHFSMPAEPELGRVTQHEFRAVVAFNIDCEEKPRESRPGQWEESDLEWADGRWYDITTYVQCERRRGS